MELMVFDDEHFMKEAMKEAQKAMYNNEVPIGAVIVAKNKIIARAYNQTELLHDVTAHAEILAYTAATEYIGNKYINDCSIYITLEPCVMCAGALFWSKINRVVFGAYDQKYGFKRTNLQLFHPKTEVLGGVLENECKNLLQEFFKNKRK